MTMIELVARAICAGAAAGIAPADRDDWIAQNWWCWRADAVDVLLALAEKAELSEGQVLAYSLSWLDASGLTDNEADRQDATSAFRAILRAATEEGT
jgi:hypothetical protein